MIGQTTDIRIDKEFHALIPPLSTEEREQLEQNIVSDGCRDPLVVWAQQSILLDGHNRHEICERHGIGYAVREIEFDDRQAAFDWIIDNQLGRRNLTPEQTSYLRGKRYNREKRSVGRPENCGQNVPISKTSEVLGEEYGVDARTIRRDGKFADAVDSIAENVGDDAKRVLLSADSKLTKQDVVEIASKPPEEQRAAVEKMAVHYSSESPEWYTPPEIIDRVVKVFGEIDLDPCSNDSSNPNIPASEHFAAADDGLSKTWSGRVYMNPPYGREIVGWIEKLKAEFDAGNTTEAIALVPSRTDTEWFRVLKEFPRCFISGRLNFSGHQNSAPFPSVVVYLGKNLKRFVKAFGDIGDVYQLVK